MSRGGVAPPSMALGSGYGIWPYKQGSQTWCCCFSEPRVEGFALGIGQALAQLMRTLRCRITWALLVVAPLAHATRRSLVTSVAMQHSPANAGGSGDAVRGAALDCGINAPVRRQPDGENSEGGRNAHAVVALRLCFVACRRRLSLGLSTFSVGPRLNHPQCSGLAIVHSAQSRT